MVFLNVPSVEASIEDHLHIGSDHETLVTALPSRFRTGGKKLDPAPDERFAEDLKVQLRWHLPPKNPQTSQEVEEYAEALIRAITNARLWKPTLGNPSAKWWSEEVRQAQKAYQKDQSEENRQA